MDNWRYAFMYVREIIGMYANLLFFGEGLGL
jgi:hypothetical protein